MEAGNKIQSSVKQRIAEYLKGNNISQSVFCERVGLSKGYLGAMRKSFQPDTINNITIEFPDLDIQWLLTGTGQMLKPAKNPFSQMTEREIGESVSEVIMDMYTKGEIYPASIYDKAIAEKNKEISARDSRIEELQREIWQLQNKIDELSK